MHQNSSINHSTNAAPIKIYGEVLQQLPKNLYIPPQALLVYLNHFEGPLDLLLYLIRSQGLSILDIPMTQITQQYLSYIQLVRHENFELVAEYMAMAATLIDIKTRMLLPKPPAQNDEEETSDPRIDLAQRLLIYEAHKKAAQQLNDMPQSGHDFWPIAIKVELPDKPLPKMPSLLEIAKAWQMIHQRIALQKAHTVHKTEFSVRDFIERIDQFFQQIILNIDSEVNINQSMDKNINQESYKSSFHQIIDWQISEHQKNKQEDDDIKIEDLNQNQNQEQNQEPSQTIKFSTFIIYTLIAVLELAKLGHLNFSILSDIFWLKTWSDESPENNDFENFEGFEGLEEFEGFEDLTTQF